MRVVLSENYNDKGVDCKIGGRVRLDSQVNPESIGLKMNW